MFSPGCFWVWVTTLDHDEDWFFFLCLSASTLSHSDDDDFWWWWWEHQKQAHIDTQWRHRRSFIRMICRGDEIIRITTQRYSYIQSQNKKKWNWQHFSTWLLFMPMVAKEMIIKSKVWAWLRFAIFTTIQFVPMSMFVVDKMAAMVVSLDNERAQSASQTMQTNLTVCGKSKACTEFQITL